MLTKMLILACLLLFVLYHIHPNVHAKVDTATTEIRQWLNERYVQQSDWECFQEILPTPASESGWIYEWSEEHDDIVDHFFQFQDQQITGSRIQNGIDPQRPTTCMYWNGKRLYPQKTQRVYMEQHHIPVVTKEQIEAIRLGL